MDHRQVVSEDYSRHIKPARHQVPDHLSGSALTIAGAVEQDYAGKDYGVSST